MWRRVSCEQLLDTSQSLLRLRGNPIKLCGVFSLTRPQLWPKGNEVLIPQPDSGTDSALVPTRQREMSDLSIMTHDILLDSAPPVYVLLDVPGHVEVDDVLHVGDIQAAGSHGGGDYDWSLATFKPFDRVDS